MHLIALSKSIVSSSNRSYYNPVTQSWQSSPVTERLRPLPLPNRTLKSSPALVRDGKTKEGSRAYKEVRGAVQVYKNRYRVPRPLRGKRGKVGKLEMTGEEQSWSDQTWSTIGGVPPPEGDVTWPKYRLNSRREFRPKMGD